MRQNYLLANFVYFFRLCPFNKDVVESWLSA